MQLNKESFEAWLFNQPRERVIQAAHTSKCFICSFLIETSNARHPLVTWYGWCALDPQASMVASPMVRLPKWAKQLIDRDWVNAHRKHCESNGDITVGEMQDRWLELWPEPTPEPIEENDRMKNKKLALAELAKDCKLKHQYLNGDGETCAIGRLAQLSAVPNDTLRKAGGESIENPDQECQDIARAIADKFGLSMDEMRTIQRLNDDHSCQELSTEERIAAVLKYVTNLPDEGGDN